MRAQASFEYVVTYGWALIIVAIIVAILFFSLNVPKTVTGNSCTFSSALYCRDIIIGMNTITGNSVIVFQFLNQQAEPLANPMAFVSINNENTTQYPCSPALALSGTAVNCTVPTNTTAALGQFVSGSIYVVANDCGLIANYSTTHNCAGAPKVTLTGSFNGHAEVLALTIPSTTTLTTSISTTSTSTTTTSSTTTTTPPSLCPGSPASPPSPPGAQIICSTSGGDCAASVASSLLGGGQVGTWNISAGVPVSGSALFNYGGYVYSLGSSGAYYAPIYSIGTGNYVTTNAPPVGGTNCALSGNYMYCINGTAAYYSAISPSDGSLGTWASTSPYPVNAVSPVCGAWNSYVYCVGGLNASNGYAAVMDTAFAQVLPSGALGSWSTTTAYPIAASALQLQCSVYSGYIYCFTGAYFSSYYSTYFPENAYYAQLTSSGIGTWTQFTSFPPNGAEPGGCAVDSSGNLYCISWFNTNYYNGGDYTNDSWSAPLSSSGVGSWSSINGAPNPPTVGGYDFCTVT